MRQFVYMSALGAVFAFCTPIFSDDLPAPSATYTLPTPGRIHPIVRGDSVEGFRQLRLREEDSQAAYHPHRYEPVMDNGISVLPTPEKIPEQPRHLSLREAIALALRNNPNVKMSELQRILDKFGLELTLQQYRVQWSPLTATAQLQNKMQPQWAAGTGIAVNAPTGTSVSIKHSNNLLGGMGSTQLNVTQHLLHGYGLVNEVPYLNALDSEENAKLTFKNNVIQSVNSVITTYRSLVEAYNTLDMDKKSLQSQEETVSQSKMQVKEGQMAPNDLLNQQSNLESTRLQLVQQQNTVRDAYFSFLTALGLVPSTNIVIDRVITLDHTKVPPLQTCIDIALKHNIGYLQELLALRQAKRALITAEDQRKWTLDITSGVTLGSERTAVGTPIQSLNTNPTLGVSLSVPIDNIQNKEGVVSAKVQIEDDKLTLEQTKETLVSNVMDQYQAIQNDLQQIKIAGLTTTLMKKTLDGAKLRLKYGKATVFEVNTDINNLLQNNINFISAEIAYLNDITTLDETLGITLDQWGIKLRY